MQLAESQVSPSSLAEVFSAAFMDVSDLDSDSFRVNGEKLTIMVELDQHRKYIRFCVLNRMQNINIDEASTILNKMNFEYVFAKFSAIEHAGFLYFTSHYFMSYKKGLIKYQLVDNVRNFEKVTIEAGIAGLGQYLS